MDRQLGTASAPLVASGIPPSGVLTRARRRPAPRRGHAPARRLAAALTIPLLGAGVAVAASSAALLPAATLCAAAAQSNHVALVVEPGSGSVTTRCVSFSGPTITGEQILQASGLEYATQSYGSLGDAPCQIVEVPASYSACLPSSGDYWALFVSTSGGAWQSASKGISSETFHSGDAEGFRYDSVTGNDPPPSRSPAGVCTTAAQNVTSTATGGGTGGPSPALIAALALVAALIVLVAVQWGVRRRHP